LRAASRSAGQEILLWKQKTHYYNHNKPPLDNILSQIDEVRYLTPRFSYEYDLSIYAYVSQWYISFTFLRYIYIYIYIYISHISHAYYVTHSSRIPLFDRFNHIWQKVQIMIVLIMKFSNPRVVSLLLGSITLLNALTYALPYASDSTRRLDT
jgi:hypothetical protein